MKIMICSEVNNAQVLFVKLALECIGHNVFIHYAEDFPAKQKNTVYVDYNITSLCSVTDEEINDFDYDIIWWRGRRKPFVTSSAIHKDDFQFVSIENQIFYQTLFSLINNQIWWVNPVMSAMNSTSKINQINAAKNCGIKIPNTLCSNDPIKIKSFVLNYLKEGVIYKPLGATSWCEDGYLKITKATRINFHDIPSNKVLQVCPGIFQQEIKRKKEIKVICFGDYLVSAQIKSLDENNFLDWQEISSKKIDVEPHVLPESLKINIRQLMTHLGLVFCCMTFILTPDDEYYFIELDEEGSFLWLEEINPEFPLLDMFIQFLTGKNIKFCWNANDFEHCVERYQNRVVEIMLNQKFNHVDLQQLTKN